MCVCVCVCVSATHIKFGADGQQIENKAAAENLKQGQNSARVGGGLYRGLNESQRVAVASFVEAIHSNSKVEAAVCVCVCVGAYLIM
jgi:hypothetical protein